MAEGADIGDVVGREISTKGDSDADTLNVTVEITDGDDVRTAQVFAPAGVDTSPRDGARALIISIGKSWQIAMAFDDESTSQVATGDMEIYALDSSGVRRGKVRCKQDGQVIVNDGSGTAVEFKRLQTAFNQLQADHDTLIGKYNGHQHVAPAGGGATGPPSVTDTASTADIDPAESDTVNIP